MIFPQRRFVLTALFSVGFVFANAGVAHALVLKWDSATWAPGDLVNSDIGIGDISFTPVLKINPNATAAGSCLAAFGLTVLARRRAKIRAGRLNSAQS